MLCQPTILSPGEPFAVLPTMCRRRVTGLCRLFHLWREWTPGSGVPTMTSAGKRDITPLKPAKPSGGVLGQERLYQRQTNKSINEMKSMSQGASILGSCKTKNDNIIKLIGSKALTQCNLNGLTVRTLLDTGAQVSMVDRV